MSYLSAQCGSFINTQSLHGMSSRGNLFDTLQFYSDFVLLRIVVIFPEVQIILAKYGVYLMECPLLDGSTVCVLNSDIHL